MAEEDTKSPTEKNKFNNGIVPSSSRIMEVHKKRKKRA